MYSSNKKPYLQTPNVINRFDLSDNTLTFDMKYCGCSLEVRVTLRFTALTGNGAKNTPDWQNNIDWNNTEDYLYQNGLHTDYKLSEGVVMYEPLRIVRQYTNTYIDFEENQDIGSSSSQPHEYTNNTIWGIKILNLGDLQVNTPAGMKSLNEVDSFFITAYDNLRNQVLGTIRVNNSPIKTELSQFAIADRTYTDPFGTLVTKLGQGAINSNNNVELWSDYTDTAIKTIYANVKYNNDDIPETAEIPGEDYLITQLKRARVEGGGRIEVRDGTITVPADTEGFGLSIQSGSVILDSLGSVKMPNTIISNCGAAPIIFRGEYEFKSFTPHLETHDNIANRCPALRIDSSIVVFENVTFQGSDLNVSTITATDSVIVFRNCKFEYSLRFNTSSTQIYYTNCTYQPTNFPWSFGLVSNPVLETPAASYLTHNIKFEPLVIERENPEVDPSAPVPSRQFFNTISFNRCEFDGSAFVSGGSIIINRGEANERYVNYTDSQFYNIMEFNDCNFADRINVEMVMGKLTMNNCRNTNTTISHNSVQAHEIFLNRVFIDSAHKIGANNARTVLNVLNPPGNQVGTSTDASYGYFKCELNSCYLPGTVFHTREARVGVNNSIDITAANTTFTDKLTHHRYPNMLYNGPQSDIAAFPGFQPISNKERRALFFCTVVADGTLYPNENVTDTSFFKQVNGNDYIDFCEYFNTNLTYTQGATMGTIITADTKWIGCYVDYKLSTAYSDIFYPIFNDAIPNRAISNIYYEGKNSTEAYASMTADRQTYRLYIDKIISEGYIQPPFYINATLRNQPEPSWPTLDFLGKPRNNNTSHISMTEETQAVAYQASIIIDDSAVIYRTLEMADFFGSYQKIFEPVASNNYTFKWYRDDLEDPIFITENSNNSIYGFDVEKHMNGHIITCVMYNEQGQEVASNFTTLLVEDPVFPIYNKQDIYSFTGKEASIKVSFDTVDDITGNAEYQWYKNPVDAPAVLISTTYLDEVTFIPEGTTYTSTMILPSISMTDQGRYFAKLHYQPQDFESTRTFDVIDRFGTVHDVNVTVYASIIIDDELTTHGNANREIELTVGDTLSLQGVLEQGYSPYFVWERTKTPDIEDSWINIYGPTQAETPFESLLIDTNYNRYYVRLRAYNYDIDNPTEIASTDTSIPSIVYVAKLAKEDEDINTNIMLSKIALTQLHNDNIYVEDNYQLFRAYNTAVNEKEEAVVLPAVHTREDRDLWTDTKNYENYVFPSDIDLDKANPTVGYGVDKFNSLLYVFNTAECNDNIAFRINKPITRTDIVTDYLTKYGISEIIFDDLGSKVFAYNNYIAIPDPMSYVISDGLVAEGVVLLYKYIPNRRKLQFIRRIISPNRMANGLFGTYITFDAQNNIIISAPNETYKETYNYATNIDTDECTPIIGGNNNVSFEHKGQVYVYNLSALEAAGALDDVAPLQTIRSQVYKNSINYNNGDWGYYAPLIEVQSLLVIQDSRTNGQQQLHGFTEITDYNEWYNFSIEYDFMFKYYFPTPYTLQDFKDKNSRTADFDIYKRQLVYTSSPNEFFGKAMSCSNNPLENTHVNDILAIGAPFAIKEKGTVETFQYDPLSGKYLYRGIIHCPNGSTTKMMGTMVDCGKKFVIAQYLATDAEARVLVSDLNNIGIPKQTNRFVIESKTNKKQFGDSMDICNDSFSIGSPVEGSVYRYTYVPGTGAAELVQTLDLSPFNITGMIADNIVITNNIVFVAYQSFGTLSETPKVDDPLQLYLQINYAEGAILQYNLENGVFKL